MLRQLRQAYAISLALTLAALPSLAITNNAGLPVAGGLGIKFGKVVAPSSVAAEIASHQDIQALQLPDNIAVTLPPTEPGGQHPWRLFPGVVHPHPLRGLNAKSYIMLNRQQLPLRALTVVNKMGCDETFEWVVETLTKKYQVDGKPEPATRGKSSGSKHFRVISADRQIDAYCGDQFVLDYIDQRALKTWVKEQTRRNEQYNRYQNETHNRNLVLQRRRSARFADSFTMGDRFKLLGAFNVAFGTPFARHSKQQFPVDVPFYAVLPQLPEAFANGDIQLVISPERIPILIRGQFREVDFDTVREALLAKYGTAIKSTNRHVIHQISDRHAILKRLSKDTIEIAFIDTREKERQRQRLWAAESEGL